MISNSLFVPLGELFKTTSGGTPSRSNSSYYNGIIPWVKSGELKESIIFDTEEHISDDALKKSSAKLFPKGTLLIALYGATIGRLAILGVNAATNQAICGIFPNTKIDLKYTYYYLLYSKPKLIQKGIGGAQPNINQDILRNQLFPLISLPEQRAIVTKLEQLFSELDNGIACLKKAQEQLKVYRQAVLKQAFEGELTKTWREEQESLPTAQELLEQIRHEREQAAKIRGKKLKPVISLTQSELDDLPKLPNGWGWVKISQISNVSTGVTPLKKRTDYYFSGTIPWVTSSAVNDLFVEKPSEYVTEIALKETGLKIYPKDTLLIAMYGEGKTRGKCSQLLIDATTNQAIAAIVQNGTEELIRPYLKHYLINNYIEIRRKSSGGVQPNLNLGIIENSIFPLAPLYEQQQIVQEIETRFSVCDNVEATIKESLEQAEALRQSILKQAFEGRLLSAVELEETRNAPDWEPAEVLLDRIRAERKNGSKKTRTHSTHE